MRAENTPWGGAEIGRLSDRSDSLLADKIAKLHIYFSLLKPNITTSRADLEAQMRKNEAAQL